VKVRGFRIELGEIETALARHPQVNSAVATTREDRPGDVRLVAYVIPTETGVVTASELRRFLGETLPSYMVPSSVVFLTAFPLTPNGKIDRKALPAPSFEREAEHEYVAPRTPLEESLAAIWENVLEIHPIGVTDDFFELGATSIVAARLFAEIERKLRTKLPLAPVFQAPTIEQLAALIESGTKEQRWTSLVPIQPKGSQTPIFCVHGGAGTVLHLQPLARRLGENQPFYGLQARGLYGKATPHKTVEDMAAHYISELREVQPEGPYDLAGYCFGGIVAFDMAQRLRAEGEDVRMLVMFNAPSPIWIRSGPSRRAQAGASAGPPPRTLTQRVIGVLTSREKIRHYAHHYWWRAKRTLYPARFWLSAKLDRPLREELREDYFLRMCAVAQLEYQPELYDGEIAMFYGEGLYDDPELGWGSLAEHVRSYSVPGEHRGNRDAMAEPQVASIAEYLDQYLTSVRGNGGRTTGAAGLVPAREA
jgi:thioesterase domain-containing protein/acyl carrier protein